MYECPNGCKEVFKSQMQRDRHKKKKCERPQVQREKPLETFVKDEYGFTCKVCNVTLKSLYSIYKHQKKDCKGGVVEPHNYPCEHCFKVFAYLSKLKRREKVHVRNKFQCPVCFKQLKREDHFQAHVKKGGCTAQNVTNRLLQPTMVPSGIHDNPTINNMLTEQKSSGNLLFHGILNMTRIHKNLLHIIPLLPMNNPHSKEFI